jgi:hypothetical protein
MRGLGYRFFADAVARCAAEPGNPAARRLDQLARRVGAPVRVAVHGRCGVGAMTVRAALTAAGVTVVDGDADLDVRVVAEVAKPEDLTGRPVLMLLNKADLSGFGRGGPLACAHRRCSEVTNVTGTPAEPMVALLALAALDHAALDADTLDALRVLVDEPADLRSPDAFLSCAHRLTRRVRQRLLDRLDLFGIAHSVVALRREGAGAQEVRAALRAVSRIDDVVQRIEVLAAETRYRRVVLAVAELEAVAVFEERIAAFLAADDTVLARMAAAVDVVEGLGASVDPSDEPAAHLHRALQWRRRAAAPLGALHRACATDITRGSLRLWAAAGGVPG